MKLIVADSSPLIALPSSGHMNVLLAITKEIVILETVFQECTAQNCKPSASVILDTVRSGLFRTMPDPNIDAFRDIDDLHTGEACANSLAMHFKSAILIDDAIGREVGQGSPCWRYWRMWNFVNRKKAWLD